MRPLELKISAFGPFKDLVELDFTSLGDSGIYLITGDTGAGKTSIFDAISYALFDDSSGGQRQAKMFRTLGASDTDETFVDLTFKLKGKIYRVVRNPEYYRKSKRGQGLTKEGANANIYLEDGQIISGTTRVNSYIQNLLGLDQNQFKQIAMLAQGDFKRMLHADNSERQALFRKIFNTHKYQELEDYLKAVNSDIKSQADQEKIEFENIVENLQLEDKKEFINLSQNSGNDAHDYLQEQIKIFESSYETLAKKRATINSDLENSKKKIQLYEDNEDLKVQIEANKKSLELIKKNILELKTKLEASKNMQDDIDQLNKINANLETLIPRYKQMEDLKVQLKETEDNLDFERKELDKLKINYKEKEKEINSKIEFLKENKGLDKRLFEKEKEILQAKNSIKELESLVILEDALKESIDQKTRLAKDLELQNEKVTDLSKYLNDQEHKYFMSQAGLLAHKLEEGKPCPVCGSTNHPSKAKLEKNLLSKEDLENIKVDLDGQRAKREKLSFKLADIRAKIQSLKEQKQEYKQYFETDLDLALNDNKNKLIAIEKDFKNIKEMLVKYEEIENSLDTLNSDFENIKINLDQSKLNVSRLEINVEKDRQIYLNMTKDLEFENKDQVQETIDKNIDKIKKTRSYIDKIIDDYQEARLGQEKLNGSILEQESRLVYEYDFDISNEKNMTQLLISQDQEFLNQMQDIKTALNINRKQLIKFENYLKKQAELSEKYATINHLYQTVSGKISGKENIKFEVFVQMTYFDEILSRANIRLSKMSQNQFSLARKKEATNKASQSGLEIEVFDKYIGKTRDIKTLSGGETFKASLALALGLSDTVQMYSGGVELNCMFVDEGFGSLDKDNLNQVMKSLNELSQTNKLIGIISHIEDLKTRIDKKIIVEKDMQNNSKATIVVE